jgi:hypothetical protein
MMETAGSSDMAVVRVYLPDYMITLTEYEVQENLSHLRDH